MRSTKNSEREAYSLAPPTQVRLLTLSFSTALGGFDERPLRTLLSDQEIVDVREHLFAVNGLPYLACLCVLRGQPKGQARNAKRPARQPEEPPELDEAGMALFQTLKAWRSERAKRDGVPPYIVFNNRELAAIAGDRPTSRQGLLSISGVGEGKVERYADELFEILGECS